MYEIHIKLLQSCLDSEETLKKLKQFLLPACQKIIPFNNMFNVIYIYIYIKLFILLFIVDVHTYMIIIINILILRIELLHKNEFFAA